MDTPFKKTLSFTEVKSVKSYSSMEGSTLEPQTQKTTDHLSSSIQILSMKLKEKSSRHLLRSLMILNEKKLMNVTLMSLSGALRTMRKRKISPEDT